MCVCGCVRYTDKMNFLLGIVINFLLHAFDSEITNVTAVMNLNQNEFLVSITNFTDCCK